MAPPSEAFSVAMPRGLTEHRAGPQAQRERQLRCRQFLRILGLGLEHLDPTALAGDVHALGPDLDDLADLALYGAEPAGQMLPGLEDLDLLAVVRGPGARGRIAAANQVVGEIGVAGPVDASLRAAAPALV